MRQFISKFVEGDNGLHFPQNAFKAICQKHELYSASDDEEGNRSSVTVECLAIDMSAIPVEFS